MDLMLAAFSKLRHSQCFVIALLLIMRIYTTYCYTLFQECGRVSFNEKEEYAHSRIQL